jgi:hypothetical protein
MEPAWRRSARSITAKHLVQLAHEAWIELWDAPHERPFVTITACQRIAVRSRATRTWLSVWPTTGCGKSRLAPPSRTPSRCSPVQLFTTDRNTRRRHALPSTTAPSTSTWARAPWEAVEIDRNGPIGPERALCGSGRNIDSHALRSKSGTGYEETHERELHVQRAARAALDPERERRCSVLLY